jgi:hypothetical protein
MIALPHPSHSQSKPSGHANNVNENPINAEANGSIKNDRRNKDLSLLNKSIAMLQNHVLEEGVFHNDEADRFIESLASILQPAIAPRICRSANPTKPDDDFWLGVENLRTPQLKCIQGVVTSSYKSCLNTAGQCNLFSVDVNCTKPTIAPRFTPNSRQRITKKYRSKKSELEKCQLKIFLLDRKASDVQETKSRRALRETNIDTIVKLRLFQSGVPVVIMAYIHFRQEPTGLHKLLPHYLYWQNSTERFPYLYSSGGRRCRPAEEALITAPMHAQR